MFLLLNCVPKPLKIEINPIFIVKDQLDGSESTYVPTRAQGLASVATAAFV